MKSPVSEKGCHNLLGKLLPLHCTNHNSHRHKNHSHRKSTRKERETEPNPQKIHRLSRAKNKRKPKEQVVYHWLRCFLGSQAQWGHFEISNYLLSQQKRCNESVLWRYRSYVVWIFPRFWAQHFRANVHLTFLTLEIELKYLSFEFSRAIQPNVFRREPWSGRFTAPPLVTQAETWEWGLLLKPIQIPQIKPQKYSPKTGFPWTWITLIQSWIWSVEMIKRDV